MASARTSWLQRSGSAQMSAGTSGGGAIFDVTIEKPGLYPFVTHSFASVDMGAVGLLRVGDVAGTMSH